LLESGMRCGGHAFDYLNGFQLWWPLPFGYNFYFSERAGRTARFPGARGGRSGTAVI
jgi:hypothetical protein